MALPKYHQSEIKDYLRCGLYHMFKHVLKLPTPVTTPLTVGSVADSAMNFTLQKRIDTGLDPSLQEVLEKASDDFNSRVDRTEWGSDDVAEQKNLAMKIVKVFYEQVAPKIDPETVQESFSLETDHGYLIGGTFDVVDKRGILIDLKTSAPMRVASYTVNYTMQPAMYWHAYEQIRGKPPESFRFDIITKHGIPQYKTSSGKVSDQDREHLFYTINQMHAGLKAGIALPASEGVYWCSKKYCPFWDQCKGKKS